MPIFRKRIFAMHGCYDLSEIHVAASTNLNLTRHGPAGDQYLVRT